MENLNKKNSYITVRFRENLNDFFLALAKKNCGSKKESKLIDYLEDSIPENGVAGLTYYTQTEKIFNRYSDEILDLLNSYINEYGNVNITINSNNLVWMAWNEFRSQYI